jgi:hypothetical protein
MGKLQNKCEDENQKQHKGSYSAFPSRLQRKHTKKERN